MRRLVLAAFGAALGAAAWMAAACGSSDGDPVHDMPDAESDALPDRRLPPDDELDGGGDAAIVGPMLLSETGLYSNFAARTVASDLFAFAPRFPFWVDGAEKSRWLYLPPGTKIDTSNPDEWVFPVGTKAFKEFRVDGKVIETRLLMKVREGTGNRVWWEAAYLWNADGSDAVATTAGAKNVLGTTHDIPTQIDCFNCHGGVSDVLIGVSAIQLTDPDPDAGSDAGIAGQLAALSAAGRLSNALPSGIDVPGTGNVKDALAYLHANCGHCHNDNSIKLNTQTKMRLRLLLSQKTPESTGAYTTTVGTVMKHPLENGVTDIVVKGDPDRSGLWLSMGRRDLYGMPPAGTKVVDDAGVDILRQWITDLP